jgi:Rho-binding antiterminator
LVENAGFLVKWGLERLEPFTRKAVFGKMKSYLPISCDFHSELELFALRQVPVEITYRQTDGSLATVHQAIQDLYARNGEEFLLLPDGSEIRLDQLVSVGGKLLANYYCG